MSYPGFIKGLAIFGPPLPPELLARRLANTTTEQSSSSENLLLTERPRRSPAQQSPASLVQPPVVSCMTCNDLELQKKGDNENFPSESKHIDVDELQKAAAAGCSPCWTLLEGINKSKVSLDGIDHVTLNKLSAHSTLVMIIGDNGAWTNNTYLEFYTKIGVPAKWSAIGPARDVSQDSSSEDCFELAQTWLHECTHSHPRCRRSLVERRKLPTRLLHVGSQNSDPKLVVTDQLRDTKRLRYAALSHCWGTSKPITTEKTSLHARKDGIPFSDLPKTFRDAVIVARRLNIEYLWVDSLCILQDSVDDWAREAEQMATVYANATLTVAADASPDAHGGLFITGEGRPNPVSIECPGPSGKKSHIYVRPQAIRRVVNEVSHSYASKGRSKLTTRGWVLQERLLSPRTLHYTENEMAWECSTCLRCECASKLEKADDHSFKRRYIQKLNVDDYSEKVGQGISNSLEATEEWKRRVKEKGEGAPIILLNWHKVVWEFTARELTRASDRLPALSGLAATMERATSNLFTANSYAFGLWYRSLALDLCWYSVEYDNSEVGLNIPSRRQTDFYAPSWSWASVTGRIKYDEVFELNPTTLRSDKIESKLLFIDVECNPMVGNRFGNAAKKSRLIIYGYLAPVKIQISITDSSSFDSHQVSGKPKQNPLVIAKRPTGDHSTQYDFFDPDVKGDGYEININDSHFVLLVAAEKGYHSGSGYCLVLKKSSGPDREYQRVGFLKTRYSSSKDWKELGKELISDGLTII